jgi:GMP synthase (glutamine-hydrolysing)
MVTRSPSSPRFPHRRGLRRRPFAVIANDEKKYYGTQFHPEVVHTPDGGKLIANFVRHVCGCTGDWTMAEFRKTKIAEIRAQVGDARVICGLSGGVDSAVAAVLIHEAIGDQLTCVFVDHGLMRLGEAEQVVSLFRNHYHIPLVHADVSEMFLGGLEGTTDPEPSASSSARPSSTCSRPRPRRSAAPTSRRARSIPT